jgi:hypothetical protein
MCCYRMATSLDHVRGPDKVLGAQLGEEARKRRYSTFLTPQAAAARPFGPSSVLCATCYGFRLRCWRNVVTETISTDLIR